jgi:hypothetical protein
MRDQMYMNKFCAKSGLGTLWNLENSLLKNPLSDSVVLFRLLKLNFQ